MMKRSMDLQRSWMFVPGHRQRMIDKALGLDADALMLDIEDGVAPAEKDQARQLIGEAMGRERGPREPLRYVRINAIGHQRMADDLAAVLRPGLDGLVLPKVESPEEIATVESLVADHETATGATVKLLVAIESPRGLLRRRPSPRARRAWWGSCSARRTSAGAGAPHFQGGGGAGAALRSLGAGGGGGLGPCPGGGRGLGGLARPGRTGAVRAAVATPGLYRHVVHPSVTDRPHQCRLQPRPGRDRLRPQGHRGLRGSPGPGRRLGGVRRPAHRPSHSSSGRAGPWNSPKL